MALSSLPSTAVAANPGFAASTAGERFVPGEALVRFEPGVEAAGRRSARAGADVSLEESLSMPRAQVVSFDGSVRAAIERLENEPGVAYAQPNYRYHALAPAPNDDHFPLLWGMGSTPGVGVLPAWDRTRGAGQVIAILDTGVDLTHPDLAANLWTGAGGIHGHDFVDRDQNPDDFNLHGTHVAGTAAATDGDATGVAGVAPDAQIMALRVLDGDGAGATADIVEGIKYAAAAGAGVINLSLGADSSSVDPLMRDAIAFADTLGAVVVAAAGNAGTNNDSQPVVPCSLDNANLICVAALTRTGARAGYSNYGPVTVDVGAPGGALTGDPATDILSTKPSWAPPVFSDDFEGGLGAWTASDEPPGTPEWGIDDVGVGGPGGHSAADSPATDYGSSTESSLQKTAPVELIGERGCRLDFFLGRAGIEEGFDFVGVGVFTDIGGFGQNFTGDSGGFFDRIEMSVSAADDRPAVTPALLFESDGDIQGDGAYVDNFNLLCRGESYDEAIEDDFALSGGSYTAIAGTSMAAPHVAGVAALVRAVDPGAPPSQIVQAIRNGAKPLASLAGFTVTGGAVDAVASMDAALALPNQSGGGGNGGGGNDGDGATPPTAPARASFGGRVVADRNGRLSIRVRGDAGTRGSLVLTANLPKPSATARRVVARRSFRIGPSGRATVRLRLSRPARTVLKRAKRLRVSARVVLTNAAGLRSTSTRSVRIARR